MGNLLSNAKRGIVHSRPQDFLNVWNDDRDTASSNLLGASINEKDSQIELKLTQLIKEAQKREDRLYKLFGLASGDIAGLNNLVKNALGKDDWNRITSKLTGSNLKSIIKGTLIEQDYTETLAKIGIKLREMLPTKEHLDALGDKKIKASTLALIKELEDPRFGWFTNMTESITFNNYFHNAAIGKFVGTPMGAIYATTTLTLREIWKDFEKAGVDSNGKLNTIESLIDDKVGNKLTKSLKYILAEAGVTHIKRAERVLDIPNDTITSDFNGESSTYFYDDVLIEAEEYTSKQMKEMFKKSLTEEEVRKYITFSSAKAMALTPAGVEEFIKRNKDTMLTPILNNILKYVFEVNDINNLSSNLKSSIEIAFENLYKSDPLAFMQGKNSSGIIGILGELKAQIFLEQALKHKGIGGASVVFLGDELENGKKVSVDTALNFKDEEGKPIQINFQVKNTSIDMLRSAEHNINFQNNLSLDTVVNSYLNLQDDVLPYLLVNGYNLVNMEQDGITYITDQVLTQILDLVKSVFYLNSSMFLHIGDERPSNDFFFLGNWILPSSSLFIGILKYIKENEKNADVGLGAGYMTIAFKQAGQLAPEKEKDEENLLRTQMGGFTITTQYKFNIESVRKIIGEL